MPDYGTTSGLAPVKPIDPTVYQNWLNARGLKAPTHVDYAPGQDPQAGLYATTINGRTVDPSTGKVGPTGGGTYKYQGVYSGAPGFVPVSSQPYQDPRNGLTVGSPEWIGWAKINNPQDFAPGPPAVPLSMTTGISAPTPSTTQVTPPVTGNNGQNQAQSQTIQQLIQASTGGGMAANLPSFNFNPFNNFQGLPNYAALADPFQNYRF